MSSVLDESRRVGRRGLALSTGTFGESRNILDKTRQAQEKPFRKGASAQRRDAGNLLLKQQQTERAALAEAESEISTRRASATSRNVGRRSLIRSTTGLSTNLGGTAGG